MNTLKKLLTIAALATAAVIVPSCEKEIYYEKTSQYTTEDIYYVSFPSDTLKQQSIIKTNPQRHLTKGYWDDYNDIETGIATYNDGQNTYTYKTMKVYRHSNPNQFFFIMLTNLNIPDSAVSWSYGRNPENDSLYGRLYSKYGADYYSSRVTMRTMAYRNGSPWRERTIPAKLMSMKDLADICGVDKFNENIDLNIDSWNYPGYYDAFIFGLDYNTSESASYHTLAGYKNSMSIYDKQYQELNNNFVPMYILEQVYEKGYYTCKNHQGFYWMNETDKTIDGTNVLRIIRHNYWDPDRFWEASTGYYANHSYNLYGFSVRYIFDPFL